jgi:hypothetical protein
MFGGEEVVQLNLRCRHFRPIPYSEENNELLDDIWNTSLNYYRPQKHINK